VRDILCFLLTSNFYNEFDDKMKTFLSKICSRISHTFRESNICTFELLVLNLTKAGKRHENIINIIFSNKTQIHDKADNHFQKHNHKNKMLRNKKIYHY
jgi:hypothetical protein